MRIIQFKRSRRSKCVPLLFIVLLMLSACVPTIQRIYHSPNVIGKTVSLQTLAPIIGVTVFHGLDRKNENATDDTADNTVMTNTKGEFKLPARSSVEARMLMAGYALQDNIVTLQFNEHQIDFIVKSRMGGNTTEESVEAPELVIDEKPDITAPPISTDGYTNTQLVALIHQPNGLLSTCDQHIAESALVWLNTLRKLYWLTTDSEKPVASNVLKEPNQYLSTTGLYNENMWRNLKTTCVRDRHNQYELDNVFKSIINESQQFQYNNELLK